jgi:hypothetical protein
MRMASNDVALTTKDNPFDPFTQWEGWYAWDYRAGYHTPSYLARIVRSSHELSEADDAAAVEDAMDEIIKYNPLQIYIKVYKEDKKV